MSFLQPAFFWAFFTLVPLAAIYFLKVRPRRKPTTAYFLWLRIFEEKHSSAFFKRLRDVWSLLLMAFAVSAVVLALTRPELVDTERKDLLLVIDRSASMGAVDGIVSRATRLDAAKSVASEIVRALGGNQRAAITTIDSELSYRAHSSDNPRELLDAIETIEPSSLPFRLSALEDISSDGDWAADYRILLVSDGCFDRHSFPDGIELLKVGTDRDNIGFVAGDLQYVPGAGKRADLFFRLASSFDEPIEVDVIVERVSELASPPSDASRAGELSSDLVKIVPVTVARGVNPPEIITLGGAEPGRWIVRVESKRADALRVDDVVHLALSALRPVRVAVDAMDPYFFERSIEAFESSSGLLSLDQQDSQVVLANGRTPDAPLAIVFGPEGESPWWKSTGAEIETAIVPRVVAEGHPALRYCDVTTLAFAGARELEPPDGAVILAQGDQGTPLVYRVQRSGRIAIVVNLDPFQADFFFSPRFPVLVHSAATHLAGRETRIASVYPTSPAEPFPGLGPIVEPGFYEVENRSGKWLTGAALLDSRESLLDNAGVEDTSKPVHRGASIAALLTALAILVLTAESLLYHRRRVG